jgi:hypothetical protein
LTLSFSVAGFTFESETVFDLSGFQSQGFGATVDLGAAQISEEILFDPYFSWNQLGIDVQFLGVQVGLDLILANIGSVQTPDYSMGTVLELSSGILCGFSITTLTGFGTVDLVNILDGIEAPFSHDLLGLFIHLDSLFGIAPGLRVTIVPGFYFEEELVRLEMDYAGLIASSSTWFDLFGFSKEIIEFGYRFEEPTLAERAQFHPGPSDRDGAVHDQDELRCPDYSLADSDSIRRSIVRYLGRYMRGHPDFGDRFR